MPIGDWGGLAQQTDQAAQTANKLNEPIKPTIESSNSQVVAAIAVFENGAARAPLVGTVLLARSAAPLNHDIIELWVILGTIAVVAMLVAALLAFALARWVSRPLAGL